jgi:cell division cycle protein 20 (cofactor of APC complex)
LTPLSSPLFAFILALFPLLSPLLPPLFRSHPALNLSFLALISTSSRPLLVPPAQRPNIHARLPARTNSFSHPALPSSYAPQSPDKILDAPDLVDDYYLNLLDWSPSNILAVALGQSVFLWNASTGATHKLLETSGAGNIVTSLSWGSGNTLSVGTHSAEIQLWDVTQHTEIRRMTGHLSRVASLAWGSTSLLSSGSRDSMIINHDTRAENHRVATLEGHQQEVCGLQWSPQGGQLASGGNDNLLNLWEARISRTPRLSIERHCAAVKALAWCPFLHNVLASGGGTADRKICLWNTGNGTCLNEVDTKSQVCAIQWSVHDREFVSSHGFTHNQVGPLPLYSLRTWLCVLSTRALLLGIMHQSVGKRSLPCMRTIHPDSLSVFLCNSSSSGGI